MYAGLAGVKTVAPALSNSKGHRVKRRLTITVRAKGVLPDPDNLLKVLLDSMKRAHLIVDDSAEWLEYERPAVERCAPGSDPSTTVTVEDLPGE